MELSFSEMVLIGIIAFIVLGPEELVKRAHQFGKFMAKLRTDLDNFKVMTQEELLKRSELEEVKKSLEKVKTFEADFKHASHQTIDQVMNKPVAQSDEPVASIESKTSQEDLIEKSVIEMSKTKSGSSSGGNT